jgi:hypothetical protein
MTGVPGDDAGTEAPLASADALAMVRVFAGLAAALLAIAFYGIVDLSVVPSQDERFARDYLLETGWGLLFTFVVPGPLLIWAFRPQWRVPMQQVLAAAAMVVLTGLVIPYVVLVVIGVLLSAAAWGPNLALRRPLVTTRDVAVRTLDPFLVFLVLVAAVGAVVYAVDMVELARSGIDDDITAGVRHIPMQAAFGLAVFATTAVAVLGASTSAPGWRVCTLPPAVAAVWFGVTSYAYPEHLASLGANVGIAWALWGLVLSAVVWRPRRT